MDFSLILFVFVVVTGLISLGYRLVFERSRIAVGDAGDAGTPVPDSSRTKPLLVEYARALFPIVLLVFVLRSFVVEPFRIPSGSMLPSLHIGDFILVNKFSYGIRLPVINHKIIPVGAPERGNVMVFRYPRDPKLHFVKRVVGLPGDIIGYKDKKLFINGEPAARVADGEFEFGQLKLRGRSADRYLETIDDSAHSIIIDRNTRGRDMTVTRSRRQLFRHGRQPRPQQRQPLLAVRAGGSRGRQGVFHLAQLEGPQKRRRRLEQDW